MMKKYTYPAIQNFANLGPSFGVDDLLLDTNLRKGLSYAYRGCNFFYEGKEKQNQLKKKVKLNTLVEINGGVELLHILKFWNLKYINIKLFIKNTI